MLKRSQISGAIVFYPGHQAQIDKYLEETEREFEADGIPMEQGGRVMHCVSAISTRLARKRGCPPFRLHRSSAARF